MPQPHPAWLKPFARLGYFARGLIYVVIGAFALFAAFGYSEKTDTKGALQTILQSGFGGIVALVLIAGLACYAAWRLVQALLDADDHGYTPWGLAIRAGLLTSGITYATLCVYTWSLYDGARDAMEGEGGSTPFAQAFAGFVGGSTAATILALVFAGVGLAHFIKALGRRYEKRYDAPAGAMAWVHPIAITGLMARGVIFEIIAFLFFYRGMTAGDGGGQPGLKDALEFIHGLPAGTILLAAMGCGLVAFALYSFTEMAWRRISV